MSYLRSFNSPEDNASHYSSVSKWDNEDMDVGGEVVMDAEDYASNYAANLGYIVNYYKPSAAEAATAADDDCEDLSDFCSMIGTGGQPSPFRRPRLPLNGSDSLLQIEHSQSFSSFTICVKCVSESK